MKGMSVHDTAMARIARATRRVAVLHAREVERRARDRRRRKHGPRPAEVLAQLRDFRQQLDALAGSPPDAPAAAIGTRRRKRTPTLRELTHRGARPYVSRSFNANQNPQKTAGKLGHDAD